MIMLKLLWKSLLVLGSVFFFSVGIVMGSATIATLLVDYGLIAHIDVSPLSLRGMILVTVSSLLSHCYLWEKV